MDLRLRQRVLTNLPGRSGLTCSCGMRPELVQPDIKAPSTLMGCCDCTLWTVFVQTSKNWRSALAFDLGFNPRTNVAGSGDGDRKRWAS